MFGEEEIIKSHRNRANAITNIVLIAFGIILSRLWFLQVYKGDTLYRFSLQNRLRKEIIRAPRGMMFGRNNELLVDNIPRFDAVLTPQFLKNKTTTLPKLAKILNMPEDSIYKILQKNAGQASYKEIVIKKNISPEEVAKIETENFGLPGISVYTFISREYIDGNTGAHLLGYISEISANQLPRFKKRDNIDYKLGDFIGQFGLEEEFDTHLRGVNGHEFVEVDAMGRKRKYINTDNLFKGVDGQKSVPGNNLKLTIDQDMQQAGYLAMEGKVGGVVAMDVNTGEILTMVSRPSFDPSQFSKGLTSDYWASLVQDENNPLRDRTIQEHYSPGSTFKAITAIAALEVGAVDNKTQISCSGSMALGRKVYHCWKKHGHGSVDVYKAIRESCNMYFQKVSMRMDIDQISGIAMRFGMGRKTGIALPREVTGLIPTKEWKKKRNGGEWQLGETLSCAIGQSYVLASPLQLAQAYMAIANGGKIYRPYLVKEIYSPTGQLLKKNNAELVSEFQLKQTTWDAVREGLLQVVNNPFGTAFARRGKGIMLAGKTGTSQVVRASADKVYSRCEDFEYKYRHHGLFVGYAPANNPKIVVAAMVEHGCHGSSAATPIVEAIVSKYMKKYHADSFKAILDEEKKLYGQKWGDEALKEMGERDGEGDGPLETSVGD